MIRRLAAWLAIAGMALNALWPLLAHAGPVEFSAPVCSTVGTKAAPAMPGSPLRPAPGKLSAPHCPFCLGAGDQTPALASQVGITLIVPHTGAQPVPVLFSQPVLYFSLAAHPRGPPSHPL